jgi:4-amino-4-deoxy-L-arabinose transferase-like glycosyltransferase
LIVIVAFVLRFGLMFVTQGSGPLPIRGRVAFGYESGQIARALAAGEGFSSPLNGRNTGPTAWLAPVYPLLLAGIFKLLGTFSYPAYLAMITLNCIFCAFTCWPIFRIGERAFGERSGAAAAWFWALSPAGVTFQVDWVWDTSLMALLCALILLATMSMPEESNTALWAAYGALWGLGALTNPSVISMLPFVMLWLWRERRRTEAQSVHLPGAKSPGRAGDVSQKFVVLVLALALVLSPWLVRNYRVLGQPLMFRSNFWLECWLGNNEQVPSTWSPWRHPNDDPREGAAFQRLGEPAYMKEKREQAIEFITSHPADFLRLTCNRIISTWTGVPDSLADLPGLPALTLLQYLWSAIFSALAFTGLVMSWRAKNRYTPVFALALGIFPLVYYLTHISMRYRYPIDPIMTVLAAYAVYRAFALRAEPQRPFTQAVTL